MVTQLGCVSETAIDSKAGSGSTISSLRAWLFKVFDRILLIKFKTLEASASRVVAERMRRHEETGDGSLSPFSRGRFSVSFFSNKKRNHRKDDSDFVEQDELNPNQMPLLPLPWELFPFHRGSCT